MTEPSTNGRDTSGKFLPGNAGGPGNPYAQKVAKLRAVMLSAVTEKDMRAITKKLVKLASAGDLKAIELLLNRTLGKADSVPQVAIQNNVSASPEARRETAMRIIARIQAERATDAEAG